MTDLNAKIEAWKASEKEVAASSDLGLHVAHTYAAADLVPELVAEVELLRELELLLQAIRAVPEVNELEQLRDRVAELEKLEEVKHE